MLHIKRIDTPGLAQVAYLVADTDAGQAAVIDPRRDVAVYLEAARALGVTITAILETHVHADFVSGARELAACTGAPVYLSRLGDQRFRHDSLDDGDEVRVGRLHLRAFWTPGHTPEHLSYLLYDPAAGDAPRALFSGDMLFVGDVGRPDLLGEANTARLVEQLYVSVFERLATLPNDLVVYPGHGAGSSCGKSIGSAPSTTIGQEKLVNYAFQPRTREEFARAILSQMPPAPTYYPVLKRVNRDGPLLLRDLTPGLALSPVEVAERMAGGAVLIDTRPADTFARAHIPGAVAIGLDGDFTTWAGWLAPYERDIVLVLDDDRRYDEALTQLRRIGLDRVAGFLKGGMAAWCESGQPVARLCALSVRDLHARLSDGDGLTVLDVRSDAEWQQEHIPGAAHSFAGLLARGEGVVPAASPLAVICGSGYRSSFAASLLQKSGRQGVCNVSGGMEAWIDAGFDTTA